MKIFTLLVVVLSLSACTDPTEEPTPSPSPEPLTSYDGRLFRWSDDSPVVGMPVAYGEQIQDSGADGRYDFELPGELRTQFDVYYQDGDAYSIVDCAPTRDVGFSGGGPEIPPEHYVDITVEVHSVIDIGELKLWSASRDSTYAPNDIDTDRAWGRFDDFSDLGGGVATTQISLMIGETWGIFVGEEAGNYAVERFDFERGGPLDAPMTVVLDLNDGQFLSYPISATLPGTGVFSYDVLQTFPLIEGFTQEIAIADLDVDFFLDVSSVRYIDSLLPQEQESLAIEAVGSDESNDCVLTYSKQSFPLAGGGEQLGAFLDAPVIGPRGGTWSFRPTVEWSVPQGADRIWVDSVLEVGDGDYSHWLISNRDPACAQRASWPTFLPSGAVGGWLHFEITAYKDSMETRCIVFGDMPDEL